MKTTMASTMKLIDLTVGTPEHPTFSVSPPKHSTTKDEKGGDITTHRSYINPKRCFTVRGRGRLAEGKSTKYKNYTAMIFISAEERARLDEFSKWLCTKLVDEKFRKSFGGQKDADMLYRGGMFKKFWYGADKDEDIGGTPIPGSFYSIYTKLDTRQGSPYKVPTLDSEKKLKMCSLPIEKALNKEIEGEYAFTISNVCFAAGAVRLQFALNAVTVMEVRDGPVDLSESDATKAFIQENMDTLIERSRKILGDLSLESTPEHKDPTPAPSTLSAPEQSFVDRPAVTEGTTAPNAAAAIRALLLKNKTQSMTTSSEASSASKDL